MEILAAIGAAVVVLACVLAVLWMFGLVKFGVHTPDFWDDDE